MKLTLDEIRAKFDEFLEDNFTFEAYYRNARDRWHFNNDYRYWISQAFTWDSTPEGYVYWQKLSQKWRDEVTKDFVLVEKSQFKYTIGDTITFRVRDWVCNYKVYSNYLGNLSNVKQNARIFNELRIEDKEAFCSEVYGYKAGLGAFPEYKSNDLEALEKIVDALKKECNKINSVWKGKLITTEETSKEEQVLQHSFEFYSIKKKTYFI